MKKVDRYFYPAIFTYAPGQEIAVDLMFRINISDHDPVGIIRRDSIRQFQIFSEPSFLFLCKTFNFSPFICIADDCEKDNHNDITQ